MEATPARLCDEGSFVPLSDSLTSSDPLGWPGYAEALASAGSEESVVAGSATIDGRPVELALFDFSFFGGSMGEVAGERLAQAMERAVDRSVPFVLRTSTGGARMQEGMRSLAQMPKIVTARLALASARLPFLVVLGNPTTGGVLASIGALADLTVAEAGATIGFAGPRVAESFTGRPLTGVSHTAETALVSGLVDDVLEPDEIRSYLGRALALLDPSAGERLDVSQPVGADPDGRLAPWAAVEAARSPDRMRGFEVLIGMSENALELRGDRNGEDDPALDAALAQIGSRTVIVAALDRDKTPGPGAYRKARRCLGIARRLGLPFVTLVDTRGADPSEESEAAGIAWEIARLFEAMLTAPVPTISIVTGEGGSGGALAFSATDLLLVYEDSIFSVIGPEGAAQILWRDPARAPEAADHLGLTAADLLRLGIADGVLPAPLNAATTANAVAYHLARLERDSVGPGERVSARQRRWRGNG